MNWVRKNYPNCIVVGPSSTDSQAASMGPGGKAVSGTVELAPGSCAFFVL